jgi:hypothetical protein
MPIKDPAKRKAYNKKYRKKNSARIAANNRRWYEQFGYAKTQTPEEKARRAAYSREWKKRPEVKKHLHDYRSTPEFKAYMKAYDAIQKPLYSRRPEVQAHRKIYNQINGPIRASRPENKRKKAERARNKRIGNIVRMKELQQNFKRSVGRKLMKGGKS